MTVTTEIAKNYHSKVSTFLLPNMSGECALLRKNKLTKSPQPNGRITQKAGNNSWVEGGEVLTKYGSFQGAFGYALPKGATPHSFLEKNHVEKWKPPNILQFNGE